MQNATTRARRALAAGLGVISLTLASVACEQRDASDQGSASQPGAAQDDGFVVQTVNYPLMYFAERIAGEHAEVRFLAPGDGDPAFWLPERDDIVAIQSADLILLNGAGYAKWVGGTSLPMSRVVDTSASFAPSFIEIEDATVHSHGAGGEHSHAGTAFTTWLDMTQAKAQAESVRDALIGQLPDHEADLRANADALLADLDGLDADLQSAADALADTPLVASHPVYQYLARRYGLGIEALLWEPEMEVTDEHLGELRAILDEHPAGWMLWEGEPTAEAVAALEGVGVRSVIFDPCGNRPDTGDWLSVMRANVEALASISGPS